MITYTHDPTRREEWDGVYYPVIVCDACLRPIDGGHGNAYWLVRKDGEIHPRIWHTHKEVCALIDRDIAREHDGMVLWEELTHWIDQLRHNLSHPLPPPFRKRIR